jgi:DNA gyrase/topoisomerase IV subunit B
MGSASLENTERFVLGVWKSVSYVPALNKMIDEIIDNAIDE